MMNTKTKLVGVVLIMLIVLAVAITALLLQVFSDSKIKEINKGISQVQNQPLLIAENDSELIKMVYSNINNLIGQIEQVDSLKDIDLLRLKIKGIGKQIENIPNTDKNLRNKSELTAKLKELSKRLDKLEKKISGMNIIVSTGIY